MRKPNLQVELQVEAAAKAIMEHLFAPPELPLTDERLLALYRDCARAALEAAAEHPRVVTVPEEPFVFDDDVTEVTEAVDLASLRASHARLLEACRIMRSLICEGDGVPRYWVMHGAALNAFVEETLHPAIAAAEGGGG